MPDEEARRKMPREYARRLNSFDVEGVVSLFTEDIIFEDPVGRPALVGSDALRTHLCWAVQGKVHEEPGRPVTSMDERYVVTPVTITISLPEEMVFRIIAIVELNEDGLGVHVRAFWGLTDMTTKSPRCAARPALEALAILMAEGTGVMTRMTRAIVLGGGWAGLLTAHVLTRHVKSVTVVERDVLPDGPRHRKGQPQARHVHVLWSSGARIVEELLPHTQDRLLAAGARKIGFHSDLVTLTASGWQYRFPANQFALMCSRPLLDWVAREQILAAGQVDLRQETEAVDLIGDRTRVTGVRVRDTRGGTLTTLEADLVVDAAGRASRVRQWLSALGVPAIEEDVVDAGVAYATRVYRAPEGSSGFPAVNVAADHLTRKSGRFGVVYPIEDGRWMVTLTGTRGAALPTREDEFVAFAHQLRDPIVADLISVAEPMTPVFGSHANVNRRLYPERLEQWPDGLLILGDSLAAFNPIYGHGMSAAARSVVALDEQFQHADFGSGGTRSVQGALSAVVDDPWIMAGLKDIAYVNCRNLSTDPRLTGPDTAARLKFSDFISRKSVRSPKVCEVVTSVLSLSAPQSAMGSPRFLSLLQKDSTYPDLTEPPFRPGELDMVGLKERGPVGNGVAV